MRLVAKYTFVLVAALGMAIAMLGYYHVQRDQRHFEDDMRTDHRVVGHVLQSLLADIWLDTPDQGQARSEDVIQLANSGGGATRFEWIHGTSLDERQRVEGHEFVSRFLVRVRGRLIGSLVVRESLDELDRQFDDEVVYTVLSFGIIVLVCLVASLTLGGWLVGKPIHQLVDKARRIARRDFAGPVAIRRKDELGELAAEMNAMSDALSGALDQIATETEGRITAVDQLRHAERLATVGRLAAGLAHELGTPLSIVSGHAQMIASREVTGDAIAASAKAIDREADRMGRIVRQLLDFARRKGPEGSACDALDVARRCITLLGPMAEQCNVATKLEVPPEPMRAAIDEDSLQHVLTNLAVNAVQAMPQGGSLRVALSRTRARARGAEMAEVRVRIDVSDTGCGIAADVLPHVFEPFFTTKQPGEGTGLGLAVVYGIVDDHRGWIEVDTGERGTTFSVFLAEAA
jgi:two-component system, NtrC family, sensor kinase